MSEPNSGIIFVVILLALVSTIALGISVFIWSIFRTRAIHYKDFIDRRNNRKSQ